MHNRYHIATKPTVYGWSVIVDFTVNTFGGISEYASEPISILWDEEEILVLEPREIPPEISASGCMGYRLKFEGAITASAAENAGIRLAYSILRVAEKRRWGLHLAWPDAPLPCRVIDRTASTGATLQGFASISHRVPFRMFVEELGSAFNDLKEIPYELLMSLELCAAARFESNSRARFVLLVSALETLAVQADLNDQLGTLINDLQNVINAAGIVDDGLRNSLLGQVGNLQRESVRRALRRLMKKLEIDENDISKIDEAYQTRSKILHEGKRVPELDHLIGSMDKILAKIYQKFVCAT
ncbi:HEPN domain-containing protein [Candidatus Nitrotoga arctica]|uniref:HEPN_Apea domain-containing protein n=1 Tax=Candidatus Nitrotoga arctica TaxID=453162 RepID=A0ABN8AJQ3_9PROT|nr:HEPN domain-containing protein [Candidatus Nitrotoga arctica]CAG9931802.1 HEPN_Apea domain-containing protein [Candidatus Nitrotoga arctica]